MIRTVADLRRYLDQCNQSPEELARRVKISNMTIRRLLARPSSARIPEKYQLQFNALEERPAAESAAAGLFQGLKDFEGILEHLKEEGSSSNVDPARVRGELKKKLKLHELTSEFRELVRRASSFAWGKEGTLSQRFLCIGALLYFLNPIDIIPDTLGAVGFLDDFAVLSLVMMQVTRKETDSASRDRREHESEVK
jgi:uncharacterized membrane protein YkvA (DUF1232 family)